MDRPGPVREGQKRPRKTRASRPQQALYRRAVTVTQDAHANQPPCRLGGGARHRSPRELLILPLAFMLGRVSWARTLGATLATGRLRTPLRPVAAHVRSGHAWTSSSASPRPRAVPLVAGHCAPLIFSSPCRSRCRPSSQASRCSRPSASSTSGAQPRHRLHDITVITRNLRLPTLPRRHPRVRAARRETGLDEDEALLGDSRLARVLAVRAPTVLPALDAAPHHSRWPAAH